MDDGLLDLGKITAIVGAVALVGLILLIPLYLSQRRDILRLHEFMETKPEHPATDLVASERLLDRAEVELERIYAERGEPFPESGELEATEVRPGGAFDQPTPVPAAARVTSERPALERITMERSALDPHPRWHGLSRRISQPSVLAAIALGAIVLAATGIIVTQQLLQSGDDPGAGGPVGLDPAQISVSVLNGTDSAGLAGDVSDDVEGAGFTLGAVGNAAEPSDRSIVMFEKNRRAAGRLVQRQLDIDAIQRIDRQTQELAGGAQVVVIVGEDRAR